MFSPKLSPKYILPKHFCDFTWGCRRIRWVLLPSLAAEEDMGKGSGDPVPMNHERTVSSGEKLILFFHGFSNTTLMWNHAGETFAGQQEHFRVCRAGLLGPLELLIHVASGTVCSTWSLGVIQIIHINFYTGMSPADALSPKCLETISRMGSKLTAPPHFPFLKVPMVGYYWMNVSLQRGRRRMWLNCFCLDGLTNCSWLHLTFGLFPFMHFWRFGFWAGSEHFW